MIHTIVLHKTLH